MPDPLADDKLWAEEMARGDEEMDVHYWGGFRVGLGEREDLARLYMESIGSRDTTSDARGRGAQDGLAWKKAILAKAQSR